MLPRAFGELCWPALACARLLRRRHIGKSARAPDYKAAAEATGESSKDVTNMQTWANRPDQNTPWGSTSWEASSAIDPSTGKPMTQWTQNTTLTPEAQK